MGKPRESVLSLATSRDVSLGLFFLQVVALVVEFSTSCKSNFQFDPCSLEIERERHNGQALFSNTFSKLFELSLIEQKLSGSCGLVVFVGRVRVGLDVGAQPLSPGPWRGNLKPW